MSELKTEAEPAEEAWIRAGWQRIDRHFGRYVDDGRLPAG